MFKTLKVILLGRAGRAEQALETENAAIIIEQKIREAEAGHNIAKRGLASLISRAKSETKALASIETRIADLESRVGAAVKAGKDSLAYDGAKLLAELENERAVRKETLVRIDEKSGRVRLAIERTHRQIIDLKQGLLTAQSIETERHAIRNMKGSLSANSALAEGEAVLNRLLDSADPIANIEALEEIESELSGDGIIDRLSDAGFGAPVKLAAADILARFQKPSGKKASA